ncbi:MAG TPA: FHA domain-containing protein [Verrucomicrobiota bacterium]|nr:FHA domain-containing protein [Verrucomicrobiota bacterium]HNT13730.1 FHA domain-containing protein [Verrucomicrobiota bacterium]
MIQLQILSGSRAGSLWETRRFPAHVGRAPQADLRLEDDGVWDQHFELNLDTKAGVTLRVQPGALVTINQTPTEGARLRNGDILTAGAARIAFRLSPTRQRHLRWREWFVWSLLALVTGGEGFLIIGWLL